MLLLGEGVLNVEAKLLEASNFNLVWIIVMVVNNREISFSFTFGLTNEV